MRTLLNRFMIRKCKARTRKQKRNKTMKMTI